MFWLKYRYTKARMVAYLNGDLPSHVRQRMARYIDGDKRCYAEYVRQKQAAQEIERDLPRFGTPDAARLNAIWTQIETELTASPASQPRVIRKRYVFGYGMAMAVMLLILIAPAWVNTRLDAGTMLPSQPAPHIVRNETAVPARNATPTHQSVVLLTEPVHKQPNLYLQNTPTPRASRR